ncbi:hypothetical protein [Aquabacter cavernae]|uniref:hypothetical protein n=1 Tax=Aquabacter cavernae TaxID=2496029 RepID=UPI00196A4D64|nr:hypothetical protein [Aquabacter cavernae]
MIRFLFIGLWVCVVTLLSIYGTAYWAAGASDMKAEMPFSGGPEYVRLPTINVPMIIDGSVRGYVIAKLVITTDSSQLRRLGVDPQVFATSAAFTEIYNNGRVDTGKLSKYNFKDMLDKIKKDANAKMNGEVIHDVLIDSINYIDKNDMRKMAESPTAQPPSKADNTDKSAKATH